MESNLEDSSLVLISLLGDTQWQKPNSMFLIILVDQQLMVNLKDGCGVDISYF